MGTRLTYCGFNLVESLLRHSRPQLERFLNRMNHLHLNTLMVQYDYGFKHYKELLLKHCLRDGIQLRLMVFGPRSFYRLAEWHPDMLSRQKDGSLFSEQLECETWPCRYFATVRRRRYPPMNTTVNVSANGAVIIRARFTFTKIS